MFPKKLSSLKKRTKKYLKNHIYQWSYMPLRHLPHGPQKTMELIYESQDLSPELIIQGYAQGMILAPDTETDKILWHCPDPRAVIPVQDFHVPSREKRRIRKQDYDIRVNTDFAGVLRGCADRPKTWLKPQLIEAYCQLHEMGTAHSVEVWKDDRLVGGLFGLQLGSYFAFISLFHCEDNTSKIATAYLLEILKVGGFTLNDCGWSTTMMEQFGVTEIPNETYQKQLAHALVRHATFEMIDYVPYSKPAAAAAS